MRYTLTITYKSGQIFEASVVGHYFPSDIPGFIVLVIEDHSTSILNMSEILGIKIPKEVYFANAPRHPSEAVAGNIA